MPDDPKPTVDMPLTQRQLQLLIGLLSKGYWRPETNPGNKRTWDMTAAEEQEIKDLEYLLGQGYDALYHSQRVQDAQAQLRMARSLITMIRTA